MTNKIKFIATDEYGWEVCDKPFPASQAIPEWWRAMTPYRPSEENPDGKKIIVRNSSANAGPKKCVPMLDAITSGYIIPLWSDVQVTQVEGNPQISWRVKRNVFELHADTKGPGVEVEKPEGFSDQVFKFINTWRVSTPPGYSILITQPFGYRQSPFHAIPAIIDSDISTLELIPPLWIKEGFEGIIEKGTPLVQVTPFKRENWKAEFSYMKDNEYAYLQDKNFGSNLVNHYARKVWSKKKYL
jgi:hypothetical protein